MELRGGPGSIRTIRERTDYFLGILRGYDCFSRSRDRLAQDVDWMLAISLGSLVWALFWFDARVLPGGPGNLSLFLLVIAFFSLSAMLFALFRATLFIIQVLMDGAVSSAHRVQDRAFLRHQRSVGALFTDVYTALDRSVMLWWQAHRIIVKSTFIIIPAFCFYVLGLSALLACVVGQILFQ